jgi:hypothetical protein
VKCSVVRVPCDGVTDRTRTGFLRDHDPACRPLQLRPQSTREESNLRRPVCKTGGLPLTYSSRVLACCAVCCAVVSGVLEPPPAGFQPAAPPSELRDHRLVVRAAAREPSRPEVSPRGAGELEEAIPGLRIGRHGAGGGDRTRCFSGTGRASFLQDLAGTGVVVPPPPGPFRAGALFDCCIRCPCSSGPDAACAGPRRGRSGRP